MSRLKKIYVGFDGMATNKQEVKQSCFIWLNWFTGKY